MKALTVLTIIVSLSCISAQNEDINESENQAAGPVRRKRDLTGTTLRTVGILVQPYAFPKKGESVSGTDSLSKYEGFIPDLLNLISDRTHIEFDFYPVPDSKYGYRHPDGSWDGMIGEVIKKTADPSVGADLAAASMTITSLREDCVDFINPFQHLGLSIIYKKPSHQSVREAPVRFQVLGVFSPGVWLMILASFLLISLLLWLINRFNPYEWRGRYERGHATQEESDRFDVSGALWFTFTTLQWQGYESSPRSFGSRVLVGFWFIFVTITMVTYTGAIINNLFWASTVMAPKDPEPFKDLEGLVKSPDYTYGCIDGGSTMYYLTRSSPSTVRDEIQKTLLGPSSSDYLIRSNEEGVQRVLNEDKYAFITTSINARFVVSQHCELAMTHKLFAKRAFGMAMRNNTDDDVREALHGAILELMEEGDIEALEEKWFDAGNCPKDDDQAQKASSLILKRPGLVSVRMFMGPMLILLVGLILAVAVTMAEIIYFKMRGQFQSGNQPKDEKLQEVDAGVH